MIEIGLTVNPISISLKYQAPGLNLGQLTDQQQPRRCTSKTVTWNIPQQM